MDEEPVDVASFLEKRAEAILTSATERVGRAHLRHYEAAGPEATGGRLQALFDTLVSSCRSRDLDAALDFAESLATERQRGGYDLSEVQTAVNVLEESVWHSVVADLRPEDQGYALGVVSTVLGAIKDRLACAYVSQMSAHPTRTLRLDDLFRGTEGAVEA